MIRGPLDGYLVLELGTRIAAGACGSLLAQLGATVVVPEPRTASHQGKWADRAATIAGKRSVCVDERSSVDRNLIEKLAGTADVLLLSTDMPGSFPATGGLSRWTGERPANQIVCDLTAYGHTGPLAGRAGSELEVQAVAGIMTITGRADGPPLAIGAPILEASAAVYAAAAILAATRVVRMHGVGQRADITLFDAAVNALSSFLTLHYGGQVANRTGNTHALSAPWGLYSAEDGCIVICTVTSEQFRRVCEIIGQPSLASDDRFASASTRRQHAAILDTIINDWTRQRTVAQAMAALSAAGIACGPIVDVADLPREPNLAHRGAFLELPDPLGASSRTLPTSPLHSKPPFIKLPDRIPLPDEDRDSVIRELAGRQGAAYKIQGDELALSPDVRPLSAVRVIEIGQYTLAPFATKQLAALGADVVKVEPPQGDALRRTLVGTGERSQIFAMMNTDKRGFVLDLSSDSARDVLHRLLAQADILVENLRPGVLANFGFTARELQQRHPHLIYCSLSGFGADSAYPGRAAFDTVVQAMSGLMSVTKENEQPFKAGLSASDLVGSQFGLVAMLAGLEVRDRTACAPHFDVAMHDATAWLSVLMQPTYEPGYAYRVVSCSDGHALLEGTNDTLAGLSGHSDATRHGLQQALRDTNVRVTPILSVNEVVAHPQTSARELLVPRSGGDADEQMIILSSPLMLRGTPARVERLMGDIGVDNPQVATDFGLNQT